MSSAGSKKWCCNEAEECSEYDCAPPSEIPCLVWQEITSESLPWPEDCFPSGFFSVSKLHFQETYQVHWWKKSDGLWCLTNAIIPRARGNTKALTVQALSFPSALFTAATHLIPEPCLLLWGKKKPCRKSSEAVCLPWLVWQRWSSGKTIDGCQVVWDGYQSLTPCNVRGGLHLTRGQWKQMGMRVRIGTKMIKREGSEWYYKM